MDIFISYLVHRVNNRQHPELYIFEESCMLMHAANITEARELAIKAGVEKEEIFENMHGEEIHWQFEGISQLQMVQIGERAMELSSSMIEGKYPRHIQLPAPTFAIN